MLMARQIGHKTSQSNPLPLRARLHLSPASPLLGAWSRRGRMLTARWTARKTRQPNPHQLMPLLT